MGDDSNVGDKEETFTHLSPECRSFISRLVQVQKRRLRLLMHLWPVLQYVDDDALESAAANLAAATAFVLYMELPTASDLLHVVDSERTDMEVFARCGATYRALFGRWFQQVGAGLWVKNGTVPMFELEVLAP